MFTFNTPLPLESYVDTCTPFVYGSGGVKKNLRGDQKVLLVHSWVCMTPRVFITFSNTFGGVGGVEGDGQKLHHRASPI